eukprot:7183967-Lingulodinium_polyedra.AAC.1
MPHLLAHPLTLKHTVHMLPHFLNLVFVTLSSSQNVAFSCCRVHWRAPLSHEQQCDDGRDH